MDTFNTKNLDYIVFTIGELQFAILGGINFQQLDRLKVTLKLTFNNRSIRHNLDLYNDDQAEKFIAKASEKLEIGITVLLKAVQELTEKLENFRLTRIEALKEKQPKPRQLTPERTINAESYLKAENLMQRTNQDIGITGIVGEENNRLLMYLVFTSRLRQCPLSIISLGASGIGKTYLQEKISELIPESDKIEITMISENAFYYFDKNELKHKLVIIEDLDGAQDTFYPLREMISKRKLIKTVPIKDGKGNLRTERLEVIGPITLTGTTTHEKVYEDNANRCLLIYLDTTKEQKERIMDYQRKLSAGKIDQQQEHQMKEFFKDMQTVLKPISVRNPYAEYLKIPDEVFKPLRTNAHYLQFIETITFYHQYQREIQVDQETGELYIETTIEDIEWANRLLKEVLLAKSDELSMECRGFFEAVKAWLLQEKRESFKAKEVRERKRMAPTTVKRYVSELCRYGLLRIVGGDRFRKGYEYEVTNFSDYETLQNGVYSILDQILADLKEAKIERGKRPSGPSVDHKQNGPPKEKKDN